MDGGSREQVRKVVRRGMKGTARLGHFTLPVVARMSKPIRVTIRFVQPILPLAETGRCDRGW